MFDVRSQNSDTHNDITNINRLGSISDVLLIESCSHMYNKLKWGSSIAKQVWNSVNGLIRQHAYINSYHCRKKFPNPTFQQGIIAHFNMYYSERHFCVISLIISRSYRGFIEHIAQGNYFCKSFNTAHSNIIF